MNSSIDARFEVPVWIDSGTDQLLGVVTEPDDPSGFGVVLLTGGGWMPSTHRNRMYVDLARELASIGCTVLRFDYPGVGDSTGRTPVFDSMRPHVEPAVAAVDTLHQLGVSRVVMVGTCYGGRTALAAARHVDPLVGLVLSGVPVKDYGAADKSVGWHLRKAWSTETLRNLPSRYRKYVRIAANRLRRLWRGRSVGFDAVSQRYLTDLEAVLGRGVRVLILEGELDKHHSSYLAATQGRLGELLATHAHLIRYEAIAAELHGELQLESQAFTRDRVVTFIRSLLSSSPIT